VPIIDRAEARRAASRSSAPTLIGPTGVAMAATAFFVSAFAWGILTLLVEQVTLSNRLDIDPPRTRMTDAMSCGF